MLRSFLHRHRYLIALGGVFLATWVFLPGRGHVANSQWAWLYLLLVGLVAVLCGARAALAAAILAIFGWNFFFLPPVHTLNIANPSDWLSLLLFAVVAITLGLLTGNMRERESEALAREHDALREADRLKSTLISSVSHELKTPLAAVTASVTSLLEDDVRWELPMVRAELTAVRDDLERLNGSISELLDFASLEADAWEPQRDWYELGEVLGLALSKFPEPVQARITDEIPDDFPLLYVDLQQLARAFQHLLENALAYSPVNAPILVGATQIERQAQCWVQDSGPGVPIAERPRVFDKFFRGSESVAMPSGTGLGLAITAEIIRYHGGSIWVEEGKPFGARFIFRLPCLTEEVA